MEKIRKKDLPIFNGQNGAPSYIAYRGKVFNVSESWHWKEGKHQAMHAAGEDLTGAMGEAPHTDDLLERVPIVGVLIE